MVHESNSNGSSYPRTCLYESGSYRQFQPSWLKQHPCFITVGMLMECIVMHVSFYSA